MNLALSWLAALQAPVIMMSQNRQGARDRSDARNAIEEQQRILAALQEKLDALAAGHQGRHDG